MASAELSRRVWKVVGYPPLCKIRDQQRRVFPAPARMSGRLNGFSLAGSTD